MKPTCFSGRRAGPPRFPRAAAPRTPAPPRPGRAAVDQLTSWIPQAWAACQGRILGGSRLSDTHPLWTQAGAAGDATEAQSSQRESAHRTVEGHRAAGITQKEMRAGCVHAWATGPCPPSAHPGRWVRIFPVCRLPARFRTQTGARHRQVDDRGLLDERHEP